MNNTTAANNTLKLILIIPTVVVLLAALVSNCGKKKQEGRKQIYAGDYQIVLHYDTVWLYDGERLVSKYINTRWDSQLDSIILKDNE